MTFSKSICLVLFSLGIILTGSLSAQWVSIGPYGGGNVKAFSSKGNVALCSVEDVGIFRSTDYGNSWNFIIDEIGNHIVYSFLFDSSIIYAGTEAGIYFSDNNGNSWNKIFEDAGTGPIYFASVESQIFVGTYGYGILSTTDNGKNWIELNNGITEKHISCLTTNGVNIFAGTYFSGIFSSNNNGLTWYQVNNGLPDSYINCIIGSDNRLFAGTDNGVYISTNSGTNWISANSNLPEKEINSLSISNLNIFAATPSGIFISPNNGESWSPSSSGLPNVGINLIAKYDSSLIAGTAGEGLFISTDDGNKWSILNNGLTASRVNRILIDNNNIFAAVYPKGVLRSNNDGINWDSIPNELAGLGISQLVIFDTLLYAGTTDGLYKSKDHGLSWSQSGFNDTNVTCIIISGMEMFLGSYGHGVFYSDDKGINWTSLNIGSSYLYVTNIVLIDSNLFVGTNSGLLRTTDFGSHWSILNKGFHESYPFITSLIAYNKSIIAGIYYNGIFISTDKGENWASINDGINTNASFYNVSVVDSTLFAIPSFYGVYYSSNDGANWINVSDGLISKNIICFASANGNIYLGTTGGIYKKPLSEITTVPELTNTRPSSFSLFQNYPNPFNPATTISFSIPSRSFVSLKIFDIVGREVATVVAEEMSAGSYMRQWDARGFASGIYFYKLQAARLRETKKLVLLK